MLFVKALYLNNLVPCPFEILIFNKRLMSRLHRFRKEINCDLCQHKSLTHMEIGNTDRETESYQG